VAIEGIRTVDGKDLDAAELYRGVRSCLTLGLCLLCDEVFEDGRAAVAKIESVSDKFGALAVLETLGREPGSFGALRAEPKCNAFPSMSVEQLRAMVFQMQMSRTFIHAIAEGATDLE